MGEVAEFKRQMNAEMGNLERKMDMLIDGMKELLLANGGGVAPPPPPPTRAVATLLSGGCVACMEPVNGGFIEVSRGAVTIHHDGEEEEEPDLVQGGGVGKPPPHPPAAQHRPITTIFGGWAGREVTGTTHIIRGSK